MSDAAKAWDQSFIELAHLESDTSEEAKHRRLSIYTGQAEYMQGLADAAWGAGLTTEGDAFKALSDSCWLDAMEATDDLNDSQTPPTPPTDEGQQS